MFVHSQYKTLYEYHFHLNERLLAGAAELSDETRKTNPGYGHGSIHDLLFHLLGVARGWREGLETGLRPAPLPSEDYQTLQALKEGFREEKSNWEHHFQNIDDETIQGGVDLTWRGHTMTFPYWRILQHVIIHGMQHQSELAHLLTEEGQSPGDLDFIFYNFGNY